MPDVRARGCNSGPVRDDMPSHAFAGANTWVLGAVLDAHGAASGLTEEAVTAAELCWMGPKRYYRASTMFYRMAFRETTDQADRHRYNAACAAALAAAGIGEDAKDLDPEDRARWRGRALEWLRAELAAAEKRGGDGMVRELRHWQVDPDLDSVRDPAELAKLPTAERRPWQHLWGDVDQVLKAAGGPLP